MPKKPHCGACGLVLNEDWTFHVEEREAQKPMGKRFTANYVMEDYFLTCPSCEYRYYLGEREGRGIGIISHA